MSPPDTVPSPAKLLPEIVLLPFLGLILCFGLRLLPDTFGSIFDRLLPLLVRNGELNLDLERFAAFRAWTPILVTIADDFRRRVGILAAVEKFMTICFLPSAIRSLRVIIPTTSLAWSMTTMCRSPML